MAKEVQNSRSGEIKKTAEDLDKFMNMVRRLYAINFLSSMLFVFLKTSKAPTVISVVLF